MFKVNKNLLVAGALAVTALATAAPSAMADPRGRGYDRYDYRDNRRVDRDRYYAPRYEPRYDPYYGDRRYGGADVTIHGYYEPRHDDRYYDDRRDDDRRYDDRRYDDYRYHDRRDDTGRIIGAGVLGAIVGAIIAR